MTVPPPPAELGDDGPDDVALDAALDELTRWVADAQVEDAVAQRRRTAWRRRQAEDELTLLGLMADFGERGDAVGLTLETGRRHQGTVASIGPDVVGLTAAGGRSVLVALDSISSVRGPADPGRPPHPGDGQPDREPGSTGLTLASALARWSDDRPPVVLVTRSGEVVRGSLDTVGTDVLRLGGDRGAMVYVPLTSVSEVGVPESG